MSDMDERADMREEMTDDVHDRTTHDGGSHATTGGAAAAGAVTGGVIGLAGGPLGAAVGAVGGALIGVAAERVMHHDDGEEPAETGTDTAFVESQPVNRAPTDQPMSGTSGSTFSDPLVEENVTIVENSTKVRDD